MLNFHFVVNCDNCNSWNNVTDNLSVIINKKATGKVWTFPIFEATQTQYTERRNFNSKCSHKNIEHKRRHAMSHHNATNTTFQSHRKTRTTFPYEVTKQLAFGCRRAKKDKLKNHHQEIIGREIELKCVCKWMSRFKLYPWKSKLWRRI